RAPFVFAYTFRTAARSTGDLESAKQFPGARTMSRPALLSALACSALIASGGAFAKPENTKKQLDFELRSASYHCEHGHRIDVQRSPREQGTMQIAWQGKRYNLARDPSTSGLPRYEDRSHGLVWIDLPWKGVLLDGRTNKPLANECRTV